VNHSSSPFYSVYFGDEDLGNYLPGLASNCNPPNLSLLSRFIVVRHLCPAAIFFVNSKLFQIINFKKAKIKSYNSFLRTFENLVVV
jgi:hypothetical protein